MIKFTSGVSQRARVISKRRHCSMTGTTKQNPKPNLMMATDYIGGGQRGGRGTLGRTRPSSPTTGVAAPWKIMNVNLQRNFLSTPKSKRCGTRWVGKLISLAFRQYVECPKRSPYVAWASVLLRSGPTLRTDDENKLDFITNWASNFIFSWDLVICTLDMFSSFSPSWF